MPNVITYNAAISACEKGQRPQEALHLLQELQLRGLLPNVITYNAAISACEKGRMPQQALNLLQEMQLRSLLPDVIEIAWRDRRALLLLRILRSALSIAGTVPDGFRSMSWGVAFGRRL